MGCPASDQWRAKVFPDDPADWPAGTDGLVATTLRMQMVMAEAIAFMDEYADELTELAKIDA
jgi:hypothetical protein